MTHGERQSVRPRLAWEDLALAPLNGLLAAVPAAVLVGLPLYLVLWIGGTDEPGRWVRLVAVGAFAVASGAAIASTVGDFLRARARIDDDLLDDEVDDRVVQVVDAIEVLSDPPAMYLSIEAESTAGAETIVLRGDYLTRLRRTGAFPSTTLRLVQLPRSRAVVGVLPMGDPLRPATVSAADHRPVEFDGEPAACDVDRLRSRAQ